MGSTTIPFPSPTAGSTSPPPTLTAISTGRSLTRSRSGVLPAEEGGSSRDGRSGGGSVNVKVIVRCRPLSEYERRDASQFQVVTARVDTKEICVSQTVPGRKVESYSRTFTFDGVCNQFTTQQELFKTYVVPIVDEVLQGFNCTIFAYGQTGTGKTYSMEGDIYTQSTVKGLRPTTAPSAVSCNPLLPDSSAISPADLVMAGSQPVILPFPSLSDTSPVLRTAGVGRGPGLRSATNFQMTEHAGIIPRAVRHIFECLEAQNTEYSVRVSYLEIYNEELNDLLNDGEKQHLRIFEDVGGKKSLSVDKLEEIPVNNPQDIFNILSLAVKKRRTAETLLNRQSSRSHCIFSVIIHMKETNIDGEDVIKIGKLNLVDLAGSENIQRSGANAVKDRAKEAGMINQSLLTLGRVINALVEHSNYVPYRDSKLTRLLQESLGGRTKTCIMATISPSSLCLEETLSTLDYAFRAKNIRNRPEVNQRMTKRVMIRELNQEIERLKLELQASREKSGVYLPYERYTEMEAKILSQTNALSDTSSEISRLRSMHETLSKEHASLEENLHEEKTAHHACQETLAHTSAELSRNQHLLQEALSELQKQIEQGKRVRGSEQDYQDRCRQLVALIRKVNSEAEVMRSKVEYCRDSGTSHFDQLKTLCAEQQETVGSLKRSVTKWHHDWQDGMVRMLDEIAGPASREGEAGMKELRERRDAWLKTIEEQQAFLSQSFDELGAGMAGRLKTLSLQCGRHGQELCDDIGKMSESLECVTRSALESLSKHLKSAVGSHQGRALATLSSSTTSLKSHLSKLQEQSQAMHSRVDKTLETQSSRWAGMKTALSTFLTDEERRLKHDMLTTLTSLIQTSLDKHLESVTERLTELQTACQADEAKVTAFRTAELPASQQSHREEIERMLISSEKNSSLLLAELGNLKVETQKAEQGASESLQTILTEANHMKKRGMDWHKTTTNSLEERSVSLSQEVREMLVQCTGRTDELKSSCDKNADDIAEQAGAALGSLNDLATRLTAHLAEGKGKTEKHSTACSRGSADLEKEITELREACDVLQSRLKPKGDTPARAFDGNPAETGVFAVPALASYNERIQSTPVRTLLESKRADEDDSGTTSCLLLGREFVKDTSDGRASLPSSRSEKQTSLIHDICLPPLSHEAAASNDVQAPKDEQEPSSSEILIPRASRATTGPNVVSRLRPSRSRANSLARSVKSAASPPESAGQGATILSRDPHPQRRTEAAANVGEKGGREGAYRRGSRHRSRSVRASGDSSSVPLAASGSSKSGLPHFAVPTDSKVPHGRPVRTPQAGSDEVQFPPSGPQKSGGNGSSSVQGDSAPDSKRQRRVGTSSGSSPPAEAK